MKHFLLIICWLGVKSLLAQSDFKVTTDRSSRNAAVQQGVIDRHIHRTNSNEESSAAAIKQLTNDYDRLPLSVREQMARNKAIGRSLELGIRKYYLLSVSFTSGSRQEEAFETGLRKLQGYVSLNWKKPGELLLHVEPHVQSEWIKEKIQEQKASVTMQEEVYYTF